MSTVSPPGQEPSTILILEDEENLIAPLRYNLEREGYLVEMATDGGEALEAARAKPPSLSSSTSCCPRWTEFKYVASSEPKAAFPS